jgi:hypothetical protein
LCPLELKIGVLPIYVLQNWKKLKKIRAKSEILDFNKCHDPVVDSIELSC